MNLQDRIMEWLLATWDRLLDWMSHGLWTRVRGEVRPNVRVKA